MQCKTKSWQMNGGQSAAASQLVEAGSALQQGPSQRRMKGLALVTMTLQLLRGTVFEVERNRRSGTFGPAFDSLDLLQREGAAAVPRHHHRALVQGEDGELISNL